MNFLTRDCNSTILKHPPLPRHITFFAYVLDNGLVIISRKLASFLTKFDFGNI